MKKKIELGFSLIELMVVVAILGIVAAIAYPSYNSYILKGNRAEAQTALIDLLQQQERYFTQRNTYIEFKTSSSGVTTPTVPFKAFSGDNIDNAKYLLSAEKCPATGGGELDIQECVRLLATPRPLERDPEGGILRITSTGFKDCDKASKPGICWK